jgi:hypothetical protein
VSLLPLFSLFISLNCPKVPITVWHQDVCTRPFLHFKGTMVSRELWSHLKASRIIINKVPMQIFSSQTSPLLNSQIIAPCYPLFTNLTSITHQKYASTAQATYPRYGYKLQKPFCAHYYTTLFQEASLTPTIRRLGKRLWIA